MTDNFKWRSFLVLGFMIYAVLLEQTWPWGVLFIVWLWPSIREGHLPLWDDLLREDDPVLFWVSTIFILSLCVWLVLSDLSPFLESLT